MEAMLFTRKPLNGRTEWFKKKKLDIPFSVEDDITEFTKHVHQNVSCLSSIYLSKIDLNVNRLLLEKEI